MEFLGTSTLICFYICVFVHISVGEYRCTGGGQRTATGVSPQPLYYLRQSLLLSAAVYARP